MLRQISGFSILSLLILMTIIIFIGGNMIILLGISTNTISVSVLVRRSILVLYISIWNQYQYLIFVMVLSHIPDSIGFGT